MQQISKEQTSFNIILAYFFPFPMLSRQCGNWVFWINYKGIDKTFECYFWRSQSVIYIFFFQISSFIFMVLWLYGCIRRTWLCILMTDMYLLLLIRVFNVPYVKMNLCTQISNFHQQPHVLNCNEKLRQTIMKIRPHYEHISKIPSNDWQQALKKQTEMTRFVLTVNTLIIKHMVSW